MCVERGEGNGEEQTAELGVLAALVAERRERADKLGELDLLVLVLVKDAQQAPEQRVLAQLGDRLKLVRRQRPAPVAVQLLEPPVQPPQLVLGDCVSSGWEKSEVCCDVFVWGAKKGKE